MSHVRKVKVLRWAFLVSGTLLAASCGSSSPTGPTPSPTPVPVSTVIAQGSYAGLDANDGLLIPLTTTVKGRIDASVDWTFTSNNLFVAMIQGPCSADQLSNNQCIFMATDVSVIKPKKLTLTNLTAGTYTLVIANAGPNAESLSYQVIFTTGSSSASGRSHAARNGPLEPFHGFALQ